MLVNETDREYNREEDKELLGKKRRPAVPAALPAAQVERTDSMAQIMTQYAAAG